MGSGADSIVTMARVTTSTDSRLPDIFPFIKTVPVDHPPRVPHSDFRHKASKIGGSAKTAARKRADTDDT